MSHYDCDCTDDIKKDDTKKSILTDITKCNASYIMQTSSMMHPIYTCASPSKSVWKPERDQFECNGSNIACSGCTLNASNANPNPSDEPWCIQKMNCHKWWAAPQHGGSPEANRWKTFLKNNHIFDSYTWAFDEKIYDQTYNQSIGSLDGVQVPNPNCDPVNKFGEPYDNPTQPDIQCDGYKNGVVNIRKCTLKINLKHIVAGLDPSTNQLTVDPLY